jgi:acetyl-CoA carboxylase carboxyltransferase component
MSWELDAKEIADKRAMARELGGAESVERHHAKGRLTVRERIDGVLDPESFREIGAGAGAAERDEDGNLTGFSPANFVLGFGKVDGRLCIVGGEDFTLKGGSPNEAGLRKSVYTEELACQYKVPLIRVHEGGGGSVAGAGPKSKTVGNPVFTPPRFQSVARALKTVPVASAALGPVAGLPASRMVGSHFSVMTRESQVMVAGPAVVARALSREVTKEELGGPDIHAKNGVVDNLVEDEAEAFAEIRRFLSYLPQNIHELPPAAGPADDRDRQAEELLTIIPEDRRKVYDMRQLMGHVLDPGSFFEMGRKFGPGLITGLARLNGLPVGVFSNDCFHYAGSMTAAGAQKVTKLIGLCEQFHLPIVTFVDEPGFMIGQDAEKAATIRYGTEAVLVASDCTVPWATVLVKKNFGVASAAHYGPGAYVLVWPSAEMGAVPAEGGVAVAFGREIAAAADPDARRRELEEAMFAQQGPVARAESFAMHELIDPRETRPALCDWAERVQPLLTQHLPS